MHKYNNQIENNPVLKLTVKTAEKLGCRAYIVGGFVRDLILGRLSTDMDIVVDGDGIEFASMIAEQLFPAPKLSVFKSFRTAHFMYQNFEYEFVGARKESYSGNSRNPVVEPATLEEDRLRRDFTINAISISVNRNDFGNLVDPFDGLGDIQRKIIKTPLDPEETFNDDPLRMLRAIRFASQLQFRIEKKALNAMNTLKQRIQIVAPERISEELNKMLMTAVPSEPFMLLKRTGLLDEILPEINALSGIERVGKHAHKDILLHTLEVLDNIAQVTDNIWLRWAALLHDVAKPQTKRYLPRHGWIFHGHEVVGGRMTEKIFRRLKLPQNEKMSYVRKIVELHLRPIALVEDEVTDSAIRRLLFDAGNDVDDLMQLCRADITSKNEEKVNRYLENFDLVSKKLIEVEEKDKIRNWQPPVTGEIIMETFGLKPSKEVGIIKSAIREAILDGNIPNDFNSAFRFMIQFAKTINIEPISKNNM